MITPFRRGTFAGEIQYRGVWYPAEIDVRGVARRVNGFGESTTIWGVVSVSDAASRLLGERRATPQFSMEAFRDSNGLLPLRPDNPWLTIDGVATVLYDYMGWAAFKDGHQEWEFFAYVRAEITAYRLMAG